MPLRGPPPIVRRRDARRGCRCGRGARAFAGHASVQTTLRYDRRPDAAPAPHGRLIAPTLPVANGYVLDARGRIVTERGKPTRRATHNRAVQTGAREPNPEATDARFPWLEGNDLILCTSPTVTDTAARRRDQRRETLRTAEALRAAGLLGLRGALSKRARRP